MRGESEVPGGDLFIIIIGGILLLFIYTTRLASNEIFSPSNKIHRKVGRAEDLSTPHRMDLQEVGCVGMDWIDLA